MTSRRMGDKSILGPMITNKVLWWRQHVLILQMFMVQYLVTPNDVILMPLGWGVVLTTSCVYHRFVCWWPCTIGYWHSDDYVPYIASALEWLIRWIWPKCPWFFTDGTCNWKWIFSKANFSINNLPAVCSWGSNLLAKGMTLQNIDACMSHQGLILLIRINVNPNMDKLLYPLLSVGWYHISIPKLQRCNRWSLGMDK